MKIYSDPLGVDEPPRGAVLTIGNFDGVHLGHQAILRYVVDRADGLGTVGAAMTLDPHPIKLLRPRMAPKLLSTLDQRLELIGRTGIEVALVVPFTHRLARMPAEYFVKEVLVERLGIREVYIGANFRFGADRGGDVALLERMGAELGFKAAASPIVEIEGGVVSSTRVRRAVADGEMMEAARHARAAITSSTVAYWRVSVWDENSAFRPSTSRSRTRSNPPTGCTSPRFTSHPSVAPSPR